MATPDREARHRREHGGYDTCQRRADRDLRDFERALDGVEARCRYKEVLERLLGLPEVSGADRVRPRF